MAGMLPGVESARRRRFHGNNGWSDSLSSSASYARSSFCLYTSNHDSFLSSISSLQQRNMVNQGNRDEKLGEVAREAKERLEERLRAQQYKKSEIPKRTNSQERLRARGDFQTQVFGSKKRFSWAKLSWKAMEQDECAVCLDQFRAGETLAHLQCAHRFHLRCLLQWLETTNAHCPCCRMGVLN